MGLGTQGRAFEDLEVGGIIPHAIGRTITQTDNIWFTLLTNNANPIHFDADMSPRLLPLAPRLEGFKTMQLKRLIELSQAGGGRRP